MNDLYVTTAIPYVNAAPHLGHALELVQADVLARHRRSRGHAARFLTGTDDNALKNVTAARAAGIPIRDFVDANTRRFLALRDPLALSFDDFLRTSQDPRHTRGVTRLWQRTAVNGDFYRHCYEGRYCAGCEQFVDAGCPEHPGAVTLVAESNWFFRLSRYQDRVLELIESGTIRIEPAARRNDVLAFIRGGLTDISVSRPAARAQGWGIPVPGDPAQVIYVWWDALANYVTALGDGPLLDKWWRGPGERVHVIGKGIVRFHAVYWPALLLSAGLPLPTAIFVHDYLTIDGAKIAKSAGNVVDPAALAESYGVDAVRWWLLREPARTGDTGFTAGRLIARADQELANGFGNLTARTHALLRKRGITPADRPATLAAGLSTAIDEALARFDFRAATDALVAAVSAGNRYVEAQRPWELVGPRFDEVLGELVALCRLLADELEPFLPLGAGRLRSPDTGPAFPVLPGALNSSSVEFIRR